MLKTRSFGTILSVVVAAIAVAILAYFITEPKIHYGGDIIEYYGMTESLLRHGSLELTADDQAAVEKHLGTGYLKNPEYYLRALDGTRRAVHFPLYSIFLTPIRAVMQLFGVDPYKVFRVGNLLVFFSVIGIILRRFLKKPFQKLAFTILILMSPLLWFLIWPGPELASDMLILLSFYFFFQENRPLGILLAAIASFQSQPLAVIPVFMTAAHLFEKRTRGLGAYIRETRLVLLAAAATFIPNLYYLTIFGEPFSHGLLQGVGLANATTLKFFELLADPNIGLFFYMPVLFVIGCLMIAYHVRKHPRDFWIPILMVVLDIAYLTNTNWNSGTAGYGPTRYALPLLPFFLYFSVRYIRPSFVFLTALGAYVFFQTGILKMNSFLMPVFENDKQLTPAAIYILDHYPALYNPTPEIFMERVQHQEGKQWFITTVYNPDGTCRKAYVVDDNYGKLLTECGYIPQPALHLVRDGITGDFYVTYP